MTTPDWIKEAVDSLFAPVSASPEGQAGLKRELTVAISSAYAAHLEQYGDAATLAVAEINSDLLPLDDKDQQNMAPIISSAIDAEVQKRDRRWCEAILVCEIEQRKKILDHVLAAEAAKGGER